MKPFSVLLLCPDYIADNYGEETFYAHVEAQDANDAVYKARVEVANKMIRERDIHEDEFANLITDFALLLVIEGHHEDLSAEAEA